MTRVRLVVWAASALLLIGGLILLSTSPGAVARRQMAADAQARAVAEARDVAAGSVAVSRVPTARVDTWQVRREPVRVRAELSCELAPLRRVAIAAEVAGRVVAVPAVEHTPVSEGAALIELETALLEAAVKRAEGALMRVRAEGRLADLELERQLGLARRKVASTSDLDRAKSVASTREAQLLEARATLDEARTRLAKAVIAAPFTGFVNELDLEPGAYVSPGQRVAEIIDLSQVEVEVGVTDRQVVALEPGKAVTLRVDVLAGREFAGRVAQVGRDVDPQTRKYPVIVHVPNPGGELLPGMLGKLGFEVSEARPVLRIPRRALIREFEVDYVYVIEDEAGVDVAHRRRVTAAPIAFDPGWVRVSEGLDDGERIAVSALRDLSEGTVVQVAARP